MALKKTVPAPTNQALSSADERLNQAGQVVRNTSGVPRAGVLPHSSAAIVTSRTSMGVDVGVFYAALVRGGGALFIMNDGTVTVPIGSAPGANSQYKVVYVKQNESESPFSDANNLPVLDFVEGVASATPDLAAAIALVPVGGLPLAAILVPSTATTTQSAGVVVSQVHPFTAMAGGSVNIRNVTERTAAGFGPGQDIWRLDKGWGEILTGSGWALVDGKLPRLVRTKTGAFTLNTTQTIFNPDTDVDTYDLTYSGGTITVNTPGRYRAAAMVTLGTGGTAGATLVLNKNGTALIQANATQDSGRSNSVQINFPVTCVAGDTLDFRYIASVSAASSAGPAHFIDIEYLGAA